MSPYEVAMDMGDQEAFDKWFLRNYRYDYNDLVIPESVKPQKEAWKAAVEYKQKQIDVLQSQLEYSAKILTDVQADKQKLQSHVQELWISRVKLWEENTRLKEQLGYY